jgi:uncharacterized membrane protein YcaP (DUF421 family)
VNGQLDRDGMRKERMNENDVRAALRLKGIEDPSEVKRAMVETDGEVSVIRQSWAEPLEQGDVASADGGGGTGERSRRTKRRRRSR